MAKREPGTRQRILAAALSLFSTRGYTPVTVADIAQAVGIKAPSLYKHYKSKQDIYEAIITELDSRYRAHMAATRLDGKIPEKDQDYYANIDEDELVRFGLALFRYYLCDEYASKFRKMLTLAHYDDKDLSAVFAQRFFYDPLAYQSASFSMLAQAGRLAEEDPQMMALHYYAPCFLLISLCDRHPEMEPEAFEMMERHIRQFVRIYGTPPHANQPQNKEADHENCTERGNA